MKLDEIKQKIREQQIDMLGRVEVLDQFVEDWTTDMGNTHRECHGWIDAVNFALEVLGTRPADLL